MRNRIMATFAAVAASTFMFAPGAFGATATNQGVTLSGPDTAHVGTPAVYTSNSPYGEFRAFGGPLNRLGEGFGRGLQASYTFRAPGVYQIRLRVGASCPGSPRLACPIDVFVSTSVTA